MRESSLQSQEKRSLLCYIADLLNNDYHYIESRLHDSGQFLFVLGDEISQCQEIHRLTSLPFQWVLSFPKDPRAEWGCWKKYPSMIRVCRITKGLPTLFTPDETNSLQPPSASAFSHPSNIRVKSIPLLKPYLFIYILLHYYFYLFLF